MLSWVYLRFFQKREHGRGDLSETFAFQTFFPKPVASIVGVASAIIFVAFRPVLMSMQGSSGKGVSSGAPSSERPLPQGSADPVDAERRRQRALRALDERISASKAEISAPDNTNAV